MVRKIVLSLIAALGIFAFAEAQNKQVSGIVTGADGNPVAGATIMVDGTTVGTTTGKDGGFSLSAPQNGSLVVSFLGYHTQKVAIAGRSRVDVTLHEDAHAIEDVVVTGYGTLRKASFTGAASIIGEDALDKKTDVNFVKSLEGAVPGLQMNNSTSMPGVWGAVYVRGRSSLNSGTQPLYVIDGMPVNSDVEDNFNDTSNDWMDPMSMVNAADIESVTVLKDAAATAIYGSRAANGVIVITTKKGSEGQFNLNLDIKQGFVSMGNNNMDFANAFQSMDLFSKGLVAAGVRPDYDTAYDFLADEYYGWDRKSSYDWMDKVTRKGYYQDYNIGISGRTGSTGYYASLGYLNTEGLVIGSDMERFSGRLNLDSKFKMFTFGFNSSYSYAIQNGFSQGTNGSMSAATTAAISSMSPMDPFYNEDGSYANVNNYNPLALYDSKLGEINRTWNQTVNLNPYLQVDFGKGIYAKTSLGANITDIRMYQYWSPIYNPQGKDYNGLGQQFNSKNTVITWTNTLGWNYVFDEKHDVGIMLGQEMQRKMYHYEYYAKSDFPFADNGMRDLASAGTDQGSEYYKQEATLASYFLDAHYAYDDKYYISGSFRRDGSSVFGTDRRWGNFWSVGAKWRLSGENFLADNQIVTNAAVRASYGTVGNQDIGWYAARAFYVSGYNYNQTPGMVPGGTETPNLTWEESQKFDVGFDLSFINRIHFSFDYYNEKTNDALFEVPLSMTTGQTTVYQNIGSIRNRGIEFSVNAMIMQKRDFIWNAYANITWNKNRVIKLAGEPIEGTYSIVEEGRPYRQFLMKEYAGVDRETGRPLWYLNESGDETTDNYNDAAKRYVGSADPKVLGGFGTNLSWKGLDFAVTFNYRIGGKVYDSGARFTGFGMDMRTPLEDVALNSWTPENKDAKYPQYIYGDPYKASSGTSSRFLYDASFLRISNITLGYTLPAKWTKKAFIQKLRLYLSLDNAYTFTASDFVGYSPETYASGVIAWQYPPTRTFTGGIQLTF